MNLIDQVYTNIDVELNDQMLISNFENQTIKETIYSASKSDKKTNKQLSNQTFDSKIHCYFALRYAERVACTGITSAIPIVFKTSFT